MIIVIITNVVITDIYVWFMYTGRMGCGIYLASTFIGVLKHATEDEDGHRWVFLFQALTGRYCQGITGQMEPPLQNDKTYPRYDSTVDCETNPLKFAIFCDNQILLRYLIEIEKETRISEGIFKLCLCIGRMGCAIYLMMWLPLILYSLV